MSKLPDRERQPCRFAPPNGLRLSGARKGVRCSRGLGANDTLGLPLPQLIPEDPNDFTNHGPRKELRVHRYPYAQPSLARKVARTPNQPTNCHTRPKKHVTEAERQFEPSDSETNCESDCECNPTPAHLFTAAPNMN